jgi:hypothetical protein
MEVRVLKQGGLRKFSTEFLFPVCFRSKRQFLLHISESMHKVAQK